MGKVKYGFGYTLGLAAILAAALMSEMSWAENSAHWFRGQLHTHTYWSDGRGLPEQAIMAYKQCGYHFVCMTEHNRFADNPDEWREVKPDEGGWPPNVTQAVFDSYAQDFGKDWVETRAGDNGASVRLKTYAECKAKFEEPGTFLLMPGVEVTQALNKFGVHLNYINLPLVIPCVHGADLIKDIKGP